MNSLKALINRNHAADNRLCLHETSVTYSFAGLTRSTCVACRHVSLERVGDGVSWEVAEWEDFTARSG